MQHFATKLISIGLSFGLVACGSSQDKANLLNRRGGATAEAATLKRSELRKLYSTLRLECATQVSLDGAKATNLDGQIVWNLKTNYSPQKTIEYKVTHNGVRSTLKMTAALVRKPKAEKSEEGGLALKVKAAQHVLSQADAEDKGRPSDFDSHGLWTRVEFEISENAPVAVMTRPYTLPNGKEVEEKVSCHLHSERRAEADVDTDSDESEEKPI